MNSFEKLLNTVRKNAPDVISEEVADQMLDDFNKTYEADKAASFEAGKAEGFDAGKAEGFDAGKAEGFDAGKAAGFTEGYTEGSDKEKAVAKQEFDELLSKCDDEAAAKLKEVVEMINADHVEKLNNIYNLFTQNYVPKMEVEAMDEDHAKKLTDAIEKVFNKKDEEDTAKLQEIVDKLNEAHAIKLQEIADLYEKKLADQDADHAAKFEEAFDKIDAQHAEQFEEAVNAINDDHAKKLESLTTAIDDDHCNKLKLACESVERSIKSAYGKKIKRLEKELATEKSNKLDLISESIEKYINYALQEAIPAKKLISEAKYNASQKALEKITSILKINNVLQESKDGIFNDYEIKLKNAKEQQNKLAMECVELKSRLEKEEAKVLLESKVAKCTPAEASFLRTYFENAKSKRIIEEQIEDARTAFRRIHDERRNEIVSKANASNTPSTIVNESKTVQKKEEPAKKQVVTESKQTVPAVKQPIVPKQNNAFIAAYAEMLKKN